MRIAFYTTSISAHQLPLAREVAAKVGVDNFRYIYTGKTQGGSQDIADNTAWITKETDWLEEADVLLSGIRDIALFERRTRNGLLTIYSGERWFKPRKGILRLLVPTYFIMAKRFIALLESNDNFYCLPMGIHAVRDFYRLHGIMHLSVKCLFGSPKLGFEKVPGGRIWGKFVNTKRKCILEKMRIWGYFVEPSRVVDSDSYCGPNVAVGHELRILWVGRIMRLKCVDTIIRAMAAYQVRRQQCRSLPNVTLDIYGSGKYECRLKKMVAATGIDVRFNAPVSLREVRILMRNHDIYVFPSNSYEGWGAVVNEALEEGMLVFGSKESGSASTMLPSENLFNSYDWRKLCTLLLKVSTSSVNRNRIGAWRVSNAADKLLALIELWSAKRNSHV